MKRINFTILLAFILASSSLLAAPVKDLKGLKDALNSSLQSFELAATITISEDLTLDLKGKTINASTANAFSVSKAKLTLKNGVINSKNEGNNVNSIILQKDAELELANVRIISTGAAIGNYSGKTIVFKEGVKLEGETNDLINVAFGSNHLNVLNEDTLVLDKVSLYKECTIYNNGVLTLGKINSIAETDLELINNGWMTIEPSLENGKLSIENNGQCGEFIQLTNTYVRNLVIGAGADTILLGLNCRFPENAALEGLVASNYTTLLRQDAATGERYKQVVEATKKVAFKVGDLEFTDTEEELNKAMAASTAVMPVVMQQDTRLIARLSQSGYLDLNGHVLTSKADSGLVVLNGDIMIDDSSESQKGCIGKIGLLNGTEGIFVKKGKVTIKGGRINGKIEASADQMRLYGGFYTNDPSSYLALGYQSMELDAIPFEYRTEVEKDAISYSYKYEVEINALCQTGNDIVVNRLMSKDSMVVIKKRDNRTVVMSHKLTDAPEYIATDMLAKGQYLLEYNNMSYVVDVKSSVRKEQDGLHIQEQIYEGEQLLFQCSTYSTAGTYKHTLTNVEGKDSVVVLELVVNSCESKDTTVEDTLCLREAREKYPKFAISGTGLYYDTVMSYISPCDSFITYAIRIKDTLRLPLLENYDDSLKQVVCNQPLELTGLLLQAWKDVQQVQGKDTAECEDLWLEVKLDSASQFVKVSKQVPQGVDTIYLRLVGETECGDTIYGDSVAVKVQPLTAKNTKELGNMPAVAMHKNWLLMLNYNEIKNKSIVIQSTHDTINCGEFDENRVTWYKVNEDSTGSEISVDSIGKGFYYTTDRALEGKFYAVINITDVFDTLGCSMFLRTQVLECHPIREMALAPLNVRRGGTMTLSQIEENRSTQISIYNMHGMLIRRTSIKGVNSYPVEVNLNAGMYLLCAENEDQTNTFKFIVNQ